MNNPQFKFRETAFRGATLLSERRDTVRRVTIKTQLQKLRDTGRYDCFKLQWHSTYDEPYDWPVPKSLFWDSDIAKWIEGACYFLVQEYDADVDTAICELVNDIRNAQQEDGYLNVYFTVVEPNAKWTNIRDQHELYNAGHLIEAALAHHSHYQNNLLLEPIERYVRLLASIFGPEEDQRHAYPGHPEIELALLRLYRAKGNTAAYSLARYFLEERGNPIGQNGMLYYDWEEKKRGDPPGRRPNAYPEVGSNWYNQAHLPILQQMTIEGHSVRAMYLLTGVADMLCLDKESKAPSPASLHESRRDAWFAALTRLWSNMVDKKMSVTGGIGAIRQWEGFSREDYFLPQGADDGGCYNETCAAIGVIMLAERLLHYDLNGRYGDVMELCLYNAVLTAMDLQGKTFTYVNQLASSDGDLSERQGWFEVACCPPNLMRLFGSLGGYLWDYGLEDDNGRRAYVNVHLYTSATVSFCVSDREKEKTIRLTQNSNWPWEGVVEFSVEAPAAVEVTVRLRIPGWAKRGYSIEPPCPGTEIVNGYLSLYPSFISENPKFVLTINNFASPRLLSTHPYTQQDTLTVARGPLVYCVEDCDNAWVADHFKNTAVPFEAMFSEERCAMGPNERKHMYISLRAAGCQRDLETWRDQNTEGSAPSRYIDGTTRSAYGKPHELVFIPYYLRANRGGKGQMRVGLLRKNA